MIALVYTGSSAMTGMVKARTSATVSRLRCMVVEYGATLSLDGGRCDIDRVFKSPFS